MWPFITQVEAFVGSNLERKLLPLNPAQSRSYGLDLGRT